MTPRPELVCSGGHRDDYPRRCRTQRVDLGPVAGYRPGSVRRLLLVALLEQGDLSGAERQAAAYQRLAGRLGIPRYGWLPEIWRAMRALLDGDPDGARVSDSLCAGNFHRPVTEVYPLPLSRTI